MKYTTVEGDEVKVGEYYETRDNDKIIVTNCNIKILGVDMSGIRHIWCAKGRLYEGSNINANGDLMRPWKEKEDHIAEDGKLVVTDELVNLAQTAFDFASINAHPLQDRRGAIKTAMQTIFDHINNSEKSKVQKMHTPTLDEFKKNHPTYNNKKLIMSDFNYVSAYLEKYMQEKK